MKDDDVKKYGVILADPPWKYRDNLSKNPSYGGFTYPPMEDTELYDLTYGRPTLKIAKPDCALFLWTTMPKLPQALQLILEWGFKYTTCAFVWIKLNPAFPVPVTTLSISDVYSGLGRWVNGNAELCLFSKRGRPKRKERNVKQVIISPRRSHSEKPDDQYQRIQRLIQDEDRIELFARKKVPGWDSFGSEDGDIRDFLR